MKNATKIIPITLASFLIIPFVAGAAVVRTEHRASSQSGGVSVSGGGAEVTGDESSSVSVQNVVTGTQGHVEITTMHDGVQTTETHDFPADGNTSTVITVPAPTPTPTDDRRTPREPRGTVAVQTTVAASSGGANGNANAGVTTHSFNDNNEQLSGKHSIYGGAVFAFADVKPNTAAHIQITGTPASLPSPLLTNAESSQVQHGVWGLITKIFSLFSV